VRRKTEVERRVCRCQGEGGRQGAAAAG
jgi:hypothetical protein